MTSASRTKELFQWLNAVAADPKVSAGAFRVAYKLSQHFNRVTGEAWPSLETLADAVGVNERTVRRCIDELCDAAHLEKKRGGDGRPNRYWMKKADRTELSDLPHFSPDKNVHSETEDEGQTGHSCHSDRTDLSLQTGQICPTNHLNEPSEELEERRESLSSREGIELDLSDRQAFASTAFEQWWQQYPRKVGRPKAQKAYEQVLRDGIATAEELLEGVMRYSAERDAEPDPTARQRFTAYPLTWLTQQRWLDTGMQDRGLEPPRKLRPGRSQYSHLNIAMRQVREPSS